MFEIAWSLYAINLLCFIYLGIIHIHLHLLMTPFDRKKISIKTISEIMIPTIKSFRSRFTFYIAFIYFRSEKGVISGPVGIVLPFINVSKQLFL